MALITHKDKIKTYSLDLPFARDEESDYCEWCGGDATHWTQLERGGEQPRSRAFFHCESHELNTRMICTSDEKYTREQVMESNGVAEDTMTVIVNYRTVLNGNPVVSEEITVTGKHLKRQINSQAQTRQIELAYDNGCDISYTLL